jgi:putative FmdB family regulatory protein
MPQYTFLCRSCNKEFSKILTLSEHEKGGIVCPHCKSKDVEQRWATIYAVTSKKSYYYKVESPGSHQRSRNSRRRKE